MTRLTVAELPTSDGRAAIYIIFNVSDFLHICPYAETHRVCRAVQGRICAQEAVLAQRCSQIAFLNTQRGCGCARWSLGCANV